MYVIREDISTGGAGGRIGGGKGIKVSKLTIMNALPKDSGR